MAGRDADAPLAGASSRAPPPLGDRGFLRPRPKGEVDYCQGMGNQLAVHTAAYGLSAVPYGEESRHEKANSATANRGTRRTNN